MLNARAEMTATLAENFFVAAIETSSQARGYLATSLSRKEATTVIRYTDNEQSVSPR